MNLDLLMKLTRLANNNPNDNEANLAARRVCKMLEEGKWALGNGQVKQEPQFRSQEYSNPFDSFSQMYEQMRRKAYEEQQRREAQYNAERAKEAQYSKVYEDPRSQYADWGIPYTKNEGTWSGFNRSKEPFWQSKQSKYTSASEQSKQKESRNLTCTWCKQTKSTKFVGLPELFVCNTCQWTAYQKDKK